MTADSFPFDASSIARAAGGSEPSAKAPTTSTPALSFSGDAVSTVMFMNVASRGKDLCWNRPRPAPGRSRSEQGNLEIHDDPEVVERPLLVRLLDVGCEESELEPGHGRRPPDGEEIELVPRGHRDAVDALHVAALGEEEGGPQPGHAKGGEGRPAPVVGEADLPGL